MVLLDLSPPAAVKERAEIDERRNRNNAASRRYRAAHTQFRKASARASYHRHKKEYRERTTLYDVVHRPERAMNSRKQRKGAPERFKEYILTYKQKRADLVGALLGKSCHCCGSDVNLDRHHIDPNEKAFKMSDSRARSDLVGEASRCVTLCRRCHGTVHARIKKGTHPLGALYSVAGIA